MDLDILERKIKLKGYYFPKLNEYTKVLYKYVTIGDYDYCIESSDLLKKVIIISITRFIPDNAAWKEESVVKITCKGHQEVIEIIDKLTELEVNHSLELFSLILTDSNMKFIKKKLWVIK